MKMEKCPLSLVTWRVPPESSLGGALVQKPDRSRLKNKWEVRNWIHVA